MSIMYITFEKEFISYRPPLIAYTGCQMHMSILSVSAKQIWCSPDSLPLHTPSEILLLLYRINTDKSWTDFDYISFFILAKLEQSALSQLPAVILLQIQIILHLRTQQPIIHTLPGQQTVHPARVTAVFQ